MIDGEHCPLREFACKVNFPKTIENFCLLCDIIPIALEDYGMRPIDQKIDQ